MNSRYEEHKRDEEFEAELERRRYLMNHSHRCPQCKVLWPCPIVSHCFREYDAVCVSCTWSNEIDKMAEQYDRQLCKHCGSDRFERQGDIERCAECGR